MDKSKKITLFTGTNYRSWAEDARLVLMEKHVWVAVQTKDFTTPKPLEADADFAKRVKDTNAHVSDCDAQARLSRSIPENRREPKWLDDTATAHSIWSDMKAKYGNVSEERLAQSRQAFASLSWTRHDELPGLINKVERLIKETELTTAPITKAEGALKVLECYPPEWSAFVQGVRARGRAFLVDWEEMKTVLIDEHAHRSMNTKAAAVLQMRPRQQPAGMQAKLCTNCQGAGRTRAMGTHDIDDCYWPGGGKEGQFPPHFRRPHQHHPQQVQPAGNNNKLFSMTARSPHVDSNSDFYIDSGASAHLTNNIELLYDVTPSNLKLFTGDGSILIARHKGSIDVTLPDGALGTIENVHYSPDLAANLLSVGQMIMTGCEANFASQTCRISRHGATVITGTQNPGESLYRANFTPIANANCLLVAPELFHKRMGHAAGEILRKVALAADNCPEIGPEHDQDSCVSCILAKQHQLPYKKDRKPRAMDGKGLGRLDVDVVGPLRIATIAGAIYHQTYLLSDTSNYVAVDLLKSRAEASPATIRYIKSIERQSDKRLTELRCDGAKDYLPLITFCQDEGIKATTALAYAHNQNAKVERHHRILDEMASTLLLDSNLPMYYWGYAVKQAAYIRNLTPQGILNWRTPHEIVFGSKPSVKYLRRFGCECFVWIPKKYQDKIGRRSEPAIFLGNTSAGYLVELTESKIVVESRDVRFEEHLPVPNPNAYKHFHQEALMGDNTAQDPDYTDEESATDDSYTPEADVTTAEHDLPDANTNFGDNDADATTAEHDTATTTDQAAPKADESTDDQNTPEADTDNTTDDDTPTNTTLTPESETPSTPTSLSNQLGKYWEAPTSSRRAHLNLIIAEDNLYESNERDEPANLQQALKDPRWTKSIRAEIQGLVEKGCFDFNIAEPHKKALKLKCVFKVKFDSEGNVDRRKTRLVAQGFLQQYGIDYDETYSPVSAQSTIRILLALSTRPDLVLTHYDVDQAYLNGDIDKEIYCVFPTDIVPILNDILRSQGLIESCGVAKLRKGLYGLKQAGRIWNQKLVDILTRANLRQSSYDHCLFYHTTGMKLTLIAVYVDDILSLHNDSAFENKWTGLLSQARIILKNLGYPTKMVGIQVSRDTAGTVKLHQEQYIKSKIEEFGLSDAKPQGSPLSKTEFSSTNCHDNHKFLNLMGSLNYAAVTTRPDISFAVSLLSKYCNASNEEHYTAAKGILRYLKGTSTAGLTFKHGADADLIAYSDSDFASSTDPADRRRSVTGWFVKLSGAPIAWKSQRQSLTAQSSTEAEIVAISEVSRELEYMRLLADEAGISKNVPVPIFTDSQSAMKIIASESPSNRTKHIDVRFFAIKDRIANRHQGLKYVNTVHNIADMLTKALPAKKVQELRLLAGISPSSPVDGMR
eukprot:Partr_v1_DN26022_c0_g1_i2_m345 putative retrotransposon Tto1 - Nicotiana tabacumSimilarity to retrotransposon Tto1 -Nicotiana tabacumSimilarity to reverse transcriptase pol - Volvox carteri